MARVYKEVVNIKHYGDFTKVVNVTKKGLFKINYPVYVVHEEKADEGGILQTDTLMGHNLKDLEEKWRMKVAEFKALYEEYDMVILYKFKKTFDWEDGSGFGFVMNWGVFRKLRGQNHGRTLFYVRGQNLTDYKLGNKSQYDLRRDGWKEIKWTQEREDFFNKVINLFQSTFENANQFFGAANVEDMMDEAIKNGSNLLAAPVNES